MAKIKEVRVYWAVKAFHLSTTSLLLYKESGLNPRGIKSQWVYSFCALPDSTSHPSGPSLCKILSLFCWILATARSLRLINAGMRKLVIIALSSIVFNVPSNISQYQFRSLHTTTEWYRHGNIWRRDGRLVVRIRTLQVMRKTFNYKILERETLQMFVGIFLITWEECRPSVSFSNKQNITCGVVDGKS